MVKIRTYLFLIGSVIVSSNGSAIRRTRSADSSARDCDHPTMIYPAFPPMMNFAEYSPLLNPMKEDKTSQRILTSPMVLPPLPLGWPSVPTIECNFIHEAPAMHPFGYPYVAPSNIISHSDLYAPGAELVRLPSSAPAILATDDKDTEMSFTVPSLPLLPLPEPSQTLADPDCHPEAELEKNIEIPAIPELTSIVLPELSLQKEESLPCHDEPEKILEFSVAPEPILVEIPAAPELPPFTMPELPIVMHEAEPKPAENIVAIPEAPQLPELTLPASIEQPEQTLADKSEEFSKPCDVMPELMVNQPAEPLIIIPEAPQLPPFTMPELPTIVEAAAHGMAETPSLILMEEESPKPAEPMVIIPETPMLPELSKPCDTMAELSVHQPAEPLMIIPEAPQLPPFTMPELPTIVEAAAHGMAETPSLILMEEESPKPAEPMVIIPETPMLPELSKPCDTMAELSVHQPAEPLMIIPEAPQLPPFTMPELPTIVEAAATPTMPEAPALILMEEVSPKPAEPMEVIPEAPKLPEFTMPEFSHTVEALPALPIPEAPKLSDLVMPEIPTVIDETKTPCEEKEEIPVAIPQMPVMAPFAFQEPAFPEAHILNSFLFPKLPGLVEVPALAPPTVPAEKPCDEPEVPKVETPAKEIRPMSYMPFYPGYSSTIQVPIQIVFPNADFTHHDGKPEKCAETIVQQRILPNIMPPIDIRYFRDMAPSF